MLQYVNYRMRITILDGRVLVGTLMAFDRHLNLVSHRFMVENDSHDYLGEICTYHDFVGEIYILRIIYHGYVAEIFITTM